MYTYDTVSAATNDLRKRGYTMDFNIAAGKLVCGDAMLGEEEFEVAEVYRFEGNSDPADEAVVYAIDSNKGHKGVLVTGYGVSAEGLGAELAKKLQIHKD